eukprot:7850528-Pyramimonas_sp.AAC.1
MSNTDVKLLADARILPVVSNTKDMIGGEQKCVGGRNMIENVVRAEAWGLERHLRDDQKAALFLTDFASAFPSLAQSWLIFVLSKMSIPWVIRRFFEAMHAENIAIVTVAGQRFQTIPIESGVKQGCPAS